MPAQSLPDEGYVRLPAVLHAFPVCKTAWWNGVRSGRFPQPVRLGLRTVAWKVEDIRALIASAKANTEPTPASRPVAKPKAVKQPAAVTKPKTVAKARGKHAAAAQAAR